MGRVAKPWTQQDELVEVAAQAIGRAGAVPGSTQAGEQPDPEDQAPTATVSAAIPDQRPWHRVQAGRVAQ